jgi:hypothetical protein
MYMTTNKVTVQPIWLRISQPRSAKMLSKSVVCPCFHPWTVCMGHAEEMSTRKEDPHRKKQCMCMLNSSSFTQQNRSKKWSARFSSIPPLRHNVSRTALVHSRPNIPCPGSTSQKRPPRPEGPPPQSVKLHGTTSREAIKCTRTKRSRHAVTDAVTGALTHPTARWVCTKNWI